MAYSALTARAAGYIVSAANDWNKAVANFAAIWVGTTAGDMDYYTGAAAKARIAKGAVGASLTNIGDVPTWVAFYPVGALYLSTVSTNPGTLLGFGTWEAFAAGRVLVGIDGTQTEFDVAEETGGAKTHALTEAELAAHTHDVQMRSKTATQNVDGGAINVPNTTLATYASTSTGSGTAHNNLQPYIVVYMWKRTA